MRALFASLTLALILLPVRAEAVIDEKLIQRLMARLSGADPLDDGTRITSRYVLRPELLDKATAELAKELKACGVETETDEFHVAVVDFTAVSRLGDQYAVFGKDVLAYTNSPTGPFEAGSFPGTAYAALQAGSAKFAAGEFSATQYDHGADRWYLTNGRFLTAFQSQVLAADETGKVYVSSGNAPFTQQMTTGIPFGGLAASETAVWAIGGKQLYKSTDGLNYSAVLQNPNEWSAVVAVSGSVYALTADGSVYDASNGQWLPSPWSNVTIDGWFSSSIAFEVDGDLIFGFRTGVFWNASEPVYIPVSSPLSAVVTAEGNGLLMAGRRGSLAYLEATKVPRRIDAPAWTETPKDPRFAVARNLIVHRPGSKVLLSAHLDSIATNTPGWNGLTDPAPGADDDLSGVSALAAVACAQPGNQSFDVLFTSGEEIGLAGSFWEALGEGKGYDYEAMLTVDEIALKTRMVFIGYQDKASRAFAEALTGGTLPKSQTKFYIAGDPTLISRADHYAYYLKGIPTVILSAGVPPPSQYHTVDDTLARADVQPIIDTARLLERYVSMLEPDKKIPASDSGCSSNQPSDGLLMVLMAFVLLLRKHLTTPL